MTWTRQVVHVAAKDLAYAKWLFVAYTIVTAITAMVAASWVHGPMTGWNFTALLAPLPMCLAAVVVLTDSPVRADAFWVTRPLDPSAVAFAKALALTIGILLPGLIGQLVALAAFDIPAAQMPGLLGASIVGEGSLILLAMAIATVVSDFRAFLVAIALFFVASQIVGGLEVMGFGPIRVSLVAHHLVILATTTVIVMLIAYQYVAVNRRGSWRVGAFAGALLLAVPPLSDHSPAMIRQLDASTTANGGRDSLVAVNALVEGGQVEIAIIDPGASGSERVVLTSPHLTVDRTDGRRDTLGTAGPLTLHDPHLDLGKDVEWIGFQTRRADSSFTSFVLTPDQADALLHRKATLRVEGTIEVDSQRIAATVPVRAGATVRLPGMIYQIDSGRVGAEPLLTFHSSTVHYDGDEDPYRRSPQYAFAVVEPHLKQAVVFSNNGSSSGPIAFPMLGVDASRLSMTLHPDFPLRERAGVIDDAWMHRATLAIIEFVPIRRDSASLVIKEIRVGAR